jgi:hypothetical protein
MYVYGKSQSKILSHLDKNSDTLDKKILASNLGSLVDTCKIQCLPYLITYSSAL